MRINVAVMIERIKDLKKKKNMTNAHLSDISGVPYGTLNKILGGETKEPSVIAIAKIAEAMHVTVDYFVTGKVEPDNGLSGEEKVHMSKYRKLDSYGRNAVNAILNEECKRSVEQAEEKPAVKAPVFQSLSTGKSSNTIELKLVHFSKSGLDKSKSQLLSINVSELAQQADFAVKVSDNSMNPSFSSGDILLVESSPVVHEGDIGIFMVNGQGYIREYDGNKLISHNSGYSDIQLSGGDMLICLGKIIGVLEEEDFVN